METGTVSTRYKAEVFDFNALKEDEILRTLREYQIVLTPTDVLTLQNDILKRPPTLAECILWSIQGSEHCSYKSSRNHLKQFTTTGPEVIIGAKEDAGIVSVATDSAGKRYGVAISHESHNHPSQIVPYEGAATGVGGNVRDVMCMGAEVIGVADSLRFGDITTSKTQWIHEGVVDGIGGYGNPLGVPNIGGDLYYNAGYNDNCLVTVVTLGIVAEEDIVHSYAPENAAGYDLILVGKPTDNSGFGGASFSSLELEEDKREQNKGAVQEPNAFLERHLLKSSYALFKILKEKNLIHKVGFKDLGAGGVACASVELAQTSGFGAEVDLEQVHVGMENLNPSVILCSETQERFMWVTHPDVTPLILQHYNETYALPEVSSGARASVVGKVREDDQYIVRFHGQEIVNAKAADVVEGIVYDRPFAESKRNVKEPEIAVPTDYNAVLLAMLSHENMASRAPVFETYDKQVQGRTLIESGDADAGVMMPYNSDDYPEAIRKTGIALSLDHNPRYCEIDPYWGAVNAVVESVRNVAAVGCEPVALTDCLCFGNPEKPEQMWDFTQAVKGVVMAQNALHTFANPDHPLPVVAGNVSFYNESKQGAIPASPMISCLGRMSDATKALSQDFKRIDSHIVMIGARKDECGGSLYYQLQGEMGANIPKPDMAEVQSQVRAVVEAINADLLLSCHDISDGGVACAIAEMTFKNGIGATAAVTSELRDDIKLFSETGGFILEVQNDGLDAVVAHFKKHNLNIDIIGQTKEEGVLRLQGCIDVNVQDISSAFENGLREKLL